MTDPLSHSAEDIRRQILDYIAAELVADDVEVGPGDDLLSGELLDSLAVLRLATFVDDTFGLAMKPSDFVVENFQNVSVLTDFVLRSMPDRGPGAS
jgi:acyl carrier protein